MAKIKKSMQYIFINKLSDIDLNKYDNDNKFIKERRFEVILTSFSSSNDRYLIITRRLLRCSLHLPRRKWVQLSVYLRK